MSSNSKQVQKAKQKQPAMPSAMKKKKAKHNSKKNNLEIVASGNHQAILFLRKLAAFKKAQTNGVLPGDIPFNWTEFFKGTQTPTIRLYMSRNDVSVTVSTDFNTAYLLTAAQFQHFSDLAAVFDEYRPIGGGVYYVPNAWANFVNAANHQASLSSAIGVIDYDNTTALASFDEGLEYDTKKWFYLIAAPEEAEKSTTHWQVQFEKLSDQQWIDTATTNTAFATFKTFVEGGDIVITNTRVGSVCGWMDFQFRGSG